MAEQRNVRIAIDGPVASGKSTIGRYLAQSLGMLYLDTGAMYRGITVLACERQISPDDAVAVSDLARTVVLSFPELGVAEAVNPPLLADGEDITARLRAPEVDRVVSLVSSHAGVRAAMVAQQRRIAAERSVVMVGRDIGTVVLPTAEVKVFLTASVEERAMRRNQERRSSGIDEPYTVTLEDLRRRDTLDSERVLSPLKPAEDSLLIDTTGLSMEQSAMRLLAIVQNALQSGQPIQASSVSETDDHGLL